MFHREHLQWSSGQLGFHQLLIKRDEHLLSPTNGKHILAEHLPEAIIVARCYKPFLVPVQITLYDLAAALQTDMKHQPERIWPNNFSESCKCLDVSYIFIVRCHVFGVVHVCLDEAPVRPGKEPSPRPS